MRMTTLCLIFLSVLSSNISAKTALPNAICQLDDKENTCQFVIDKNKGYANIMINGTIIRIAMMSNKPVSVSKYENLLSQGNCENLSAIGDYDEFNFYVIDTYCAE